MRHVEFLGRAIEGSEWRCERPDAVGVNADLSVVAVWSSWESADRKLITRHTEDGTAVSTLELPEAIQPTFVQSLPNDRILIVNARWSEARPVNAQVWDNEGALESAVDLDDAIEHVLAMPDGSLWVGYFDEKSGSHYPGAHGLVRFDPDLKPVWTYPFDGTLPDQFDCLALNVSGSAVWTCSYTSHRLVSVTGDVITDHGAAPQHGATGLLIDAEGRRGALLGGYGPDYDVVVPFWITRDGLVEAGKRGRVVMPDGLELRRQRWSCREGIARLTVGTALYELTLASIFAALV